MPVFSASISVKQGDIANLSKTLTSKPLHASLARFISKKLVAVRSDIKTIVGQHYSILENIDKVTSGPRLQRDATAPGRKITGFTLEYAYKKVRLSSYPTYQVRATTQKRLLEVQRSKKGKFDQRIVSVNYIQTLVKVKKDWRLVVGKHGPDINKGRPGYMGWLHTGKLNRKRFRSAGIYERAQAATWSGGQRLPVFELYGPSFTEILRDKAVVQDTLNSKSFRDLENYLTKRVSVDG